VAFKLTDRRTPSRALCACAALCALLAAASALSAQTYQKPPQAVLDVLNAPVPPTGALSPTREYMLLAQGVRYPPISELAQPMLRLAGLRINPNTTGRHRAPYYIALSLKRVSDGSERKVELPSGAQAGLPVWSADGRRFAFTNTTPTGIELWAGDPASARVWKLNGIVVGAVYGTPVQWMPDNKTLLVQTVPAKRAAPPAEETVPKAPNIQESSGRPGPVRTYQDLLKNAHDEDLFDFYATAQLALVDAETGKTTALGAPAIFDEAEPSPDGAHILVARLHRPYSYLNPAEDFPKEVEV
jgi:dipeptidyl aminopeptidase/acylaminoacyl peptidase